MNPGKLAATFFAAAIVMGLAASVGAVDGTIEINQAKVMAAGGFPYVISNAGSYRLTGNLKVSSTTADAIDVNVDNVTVDLNGFSITGPGFGSASGNGVGGTSNNITVENGTVTGFSAGTDVITGNNGIVRNLHVISGGEGIQAAGGSLISGNTIINNIDKGIYCVSTCGYSGNVLIANGANTSIAAVSMGNNLCTSVAC
jgi:hypothetical protein